MNTADTTLDLPLNESEQRLADLIYDAHRIASAAICREPLPKP